MSSHQWQPILLCCPPPKRSGYGYWGEGAAIDKVRPVVEPYYSGWLLPKKQAKWIIGEKDGQVFFGRYGKVEDVMGSEYPAAADNVGRRLEFFLGYSAPSGTPLPRVEDFERIEETMRADIDKFYAELTETYPNNRSITPSPTAFEFSGAQQEAVSDHAWDKMVSEIETGKKSTLLVINQQGEVQTQDLTPEPPPRNDDRSGSPPREGTEQKKNGEPPEQVSEQKVGQSSARQSTGYAATAHLTGSSRSGNTPAFDGGKAAILVSLCVAAIGGITTLLYQLRRKKDRQKAQTKDRDTGRLALISRNKEHGDYPER